MQIAYISLKKIEDAIAFEEAWYRHNNRETLGYEYFSTAAQIYATAFPGEEGNPFVPTLRTLIDDLPASEELNYQDFWWLGFGSSHPARVHYLLRNWDEAERIVMKMRRFEWKEILSQYKVNEHFPVSTIGVNQTKMEVEGFLGCIYARQGKRKEAFAQIQVLEQLMTEGPSTRNIFLFGTAPYLQAQIYAILGEKELAVNSIREAIKAGIMQDFIKFNLNLVNLRGYEPYEELIRPKFPLVKG